MEKLKVQFFSEAELQVYRNWPRPLARHAALSFFAQCVRGAISKNYSSVKFYVNGVLANMVIFAEGQSYFQKKLNTNFSPKIGLQFFGKRSWPPAQTSFLGRRSACSKAPIVQTTLHLCLFNYTVFVSRLQGSSQQA